MHKYDALHQGVLRYNLKDFRDCFGVEDEIPIKREAILKRPMLYPLESKAAKDKVTTGTNLVVFLYKYASAKNKYVKYICLNKCVKT